MLDEHEWKSVLQVARDGTFSLAARNLYISQPSLSQCVKKIEGELGAELFDRSQTPLKLTEVGEIYVRQARELERIQKELISSVADARELKVGTLTIGSSHTRAECYLISPLVRFRRLYPGIRLSVLERPNIELLGALERGEADLATLYEPLDKKKFEAVPLLKERVLLAVPQGHRLTEGMSAQPLPLPKISFRKLTGEPFIKLQQGRGLARTFEELCAATGAAPEVVFEANSIMDAVQLAAAGMGLTLVTDMILYHAALTRMPFFFELTEELPSRELAAVFVKNRHLSAAARRFIELLQSREKI